MFKPLAIRVLLVSLALSSFGAHAQSYQALLDFQARGLLDLSIPAPPPVDTGSCASPADAPSNWNPDTDCESAAVDANGRHIIIQSPHHIQGCNAGLVKMEGTYVCKTFVTAAGWDVIYPPVYVAGGSGGGSGGRGGGAFGPCSGGCTGSVVDGTGRAVTSGDGSTVHSDSGGGGDSP
jgi:hypothetical protein